MRKSKIFSSIWDVVKLDLSSLHSNFDPFQVRSLLATRDLTKTAASDFTTIGTTGSGGNAVSKADLTARLNLIEDKFNTILGQTTTTFSCPT